MVFLHFSFFVCIVKVLLITENMENSEIKSQVIFLNTCNPNVKASLASWHISKKVTVVSDSLRPHGLYSLWNSPGRNTWVGNLSLLQGIVPTQEWNTDLLLCRCILYQLSHKRSPWISVPAYKYDEIIRVAFLFLWGLNFSFYKKLKNGKNKWMSLINRK